MPALAACMFLVTAACAAEPRLSPATTAGEAGLVDIETRVPDITLDMRYAGRHNFVGRRIDGYLAPRCYLLEPAAAALQRVELALREQHLRLKLFDCYRPARAVRDFVEWAGDPGDQHTKPEYYPNVDKRDLLGVYIAPVSGHSRGATVDLTLLQCRDDDTHCRALDMGTHFDFFDARAHTESAGVTAEQQRNRERLLDAMTRQGFRNYELEWWHYTLTPEPSPDTIFDVPVTTGTRISDIDSIMQNYQGDVPGASVLVVRDGKAVVRRAYGLANLEQRTAATPATNYRLASVTKQFTAAATLLLIEDGRLSLDHPVRKWLPSLPASDDAITIRHLLTHMSGLIDYEEIMPADLETQLRDADVLALLEQEQDLYFEPGTAYRYSNGGYALLALVVERVSGKSFQSFLRERIFEPLGMKNTLAYVAEGPPVANRAYGYSRADDRWLRTDQSPTSAVLGDGGIYSSIDDLAKWDAALYDDRLLSAESRGLAFTPWTGTDEADVAYGFGWRITGETLWHSGETIGFRNVIVRWPQRRITVIILSNRNEPEPYRMALTIADRFLSP